MSFIDLDIDLKVIIFFIIICWQAKATRELWEAQGDFNSGDEVPSAQSFPPNQECHCLFHPLQLMGFARWKSMWRSFTNSSHVMTCTIDNNIWGSNCGRVHRRVLPTHRT